MRDADEGKPCMIKQTVNQELEQVSKTILQNQSLLNIGI